MESAAGGGIESVVAQPQSGKLTAAAAKESADDLRRLGDSLDAVHLQKMKLMTESVDKVLAPTPQPTQQQQPPNNNNHVGSKAADLDEILQIVELSDLVEPTAHSHLNRQLIDLAGGGGGEKCDVTPENSKKSDQEVSPDSLVNCPQFPTSSGPRDSVLLIDFEGSGGGGEVGGGSDNSGMQLRQQFCDMDSLAEDGNHSELTLLDLDELPREKTPVKAFTISFGEEERSEEQKQKYEKMFERFQNKRHRRGQSLSKVDLELSKSASQDSHPSPANRSSGGAPAGHRLAKTPSSAKLPRKTFSEPTSKAGNEDQQQQHLDDDAKVKLRDKRNAALREPSKRHSWSPRTTTGSACGGAANSTAQPPIVAAPAVVEVAAPALPKKEDLPPPAPPAIEEKRPLQMPLNGKFTARSSVLAKVLVDTAARNVIESGSGGLMGQVQQQSKQPLSSKNAMQRGFVCDAPPLIDDSKGGDDEVEEDVSDAGTYTLDGDNYTEEQKEMMDIDNLRKEAQLLHKWDDNPEEVEAITFLKCRRPPLQRPTSFEPSLEIIDLELIPSSPRELRALESNLDGYDTDEHYPVKLPAHRPAPQPTTRSNGRNVLEITCSYEEPPSEKHPGKPKVSYLEKIKTKVKSLGVKSVNRTSIEPEKQLVSPDLGTFTSVTTSGILSYKPTLEDHPKQLNRRNSLTKTQIQNSEYVQGVSRVVDVISSSQNDDEKIMNSITDSDKLNLLSSSENDESQSQSSALKSAVTKNDWIHEWAKSARRSTSEMSRSFTVGSDVNRLRDGEDPMSRSECFTQDEYGDNLERNHQALHQQKKQHLVKRGANLESNFVRNSGKGDLDAGSPLSQLRYSVRRRYSGDKGEILGNNDAMVAAAAGRRPPMSPTKIPSPVHTISRARSQSHNRSHGGSTADLSTGVGGSQQRLMSPPNDTDVYLQNTAAAILTLQTQMHLNNSLHNSPNQSHPGSPGRGRVNLAGVPSPKVTSPLHSLSPRPEGYNIIEECQNKMNRIQQLHKRNLSLDGSERDRNRTRYGKSNSANMGRVQRADPQHTRHHSYEGGQGTMANRQNHLVMRGIDQTMEGGEDGVELRGVVARQQQKGHLVGNAAPQSSPIRRSSSFSTKPMTEGGGGRGGGPNGVNGSNGGAGHQRVARQMNSIKKSASSTSFKKYHFEDDGDIYINDDDDLDPGRMSNESEYSYDLDMDQGQGQNSHPITNTRCNKAFMMRMEQNKKPGQGSGQMAATGVAVTVAQATMQKQGVVACPNTPEMSRRGKIMVRQPLRDRQSMPRDSSLNRMKQDLNMNLNSTKKVLKTTGSGGSSGVGSSGGGGVKVQPKYLDISKYKPTTSGNFLKKDESKSYLVKGGAGGGAGGSSSVATDGIKRSPSSASVTLTRTDPTRMSNRSVKSAGMKPNMKKEAIAPLKQTKEQELAMWRRRASYDPMKAAMEGKKRQEEAKRLAQQQQCKLTESSMVLRSQSFHSGATMMRQANDGLIDDESNPDTSSQNQWTITSTESSDEDF